MHFLRYPFIGDDTRVVLGQRHKDQDATAVARSTNRAHDELLDGGAVGAGALYRARYKQNAQRRPGESESRNKEDDELRQEDALHAPLREIDQRPRREKRQYARP